MKIGFSLMAVVLVASALPSLAWADTRLHPAQITQVVVEEVLPPAPPPPAPGTRARPAPKPPKKAPPKVYQLVVVYRNDQGETARHLVPCADRAACDALQSGLSSEIGIGRRVVLKSEPAAVETAPAPTIAPVCAESSIIEAGQNQDTIQVTLTSELVVPANRTRVALNNSCELRLRRRVATERRIAARPLYATLQDTPPENEGESGTVPYFPIRTKNPITDERRRVLPCNDESNPWCGGFQVAALTVSDDPDVAAIVCVHRRPVDGNPISRKMRALQTLLEAERGGQAYARSSIGRADSCVTAENSVQTIPQTPSAPIRAPGAAEAQSGNVAKAPPVETPPPAPVNPSSSHASKHAGGT
jgi:hypothetical protein